MFKYNQGTSVMALNVNQGQWSLSMVSLVALYQSTINP